MDVYEGGRIEVKLSDEGDSVADMLSYVLLDPGRLLKALRDQVRESGVEERLQCRFVDEFSSGLYGYTYLEEEEAPDARLPPARLTEGCRRRSRGQKVTCSWQRGQKSDQRHFPKEKAALRDSGKNLSRECCNC